MTYLSAADLQTAENRPLPGVWGDVERLVASTGVTWTFVRAGGFAANTLDWAEQIRRGDTVVLPFLEARRSPVHEKDIADVAVAGLLDPRHRNQAYVVTGPEQLSQAEQVQVIGTVLGRRLTVREQAVADARAELAAELGPDFAEQLLSHWADLVTSPERVSTDVLEVTGHPARTYAEWVADHREDFTSDRSGTRSDTAPAPTGVANGT